jgi:hypothetical protein
MNEVMVLCCDDERESLKGVLTVVLIHCSYSVLCQKTQAWEQSV